MSTPEYRWLCHRCGSPNEPRTEKCAACGFAAVASAEQIDRSRPDYQPQKRNAARSELADRIWLFFPEGVLGAILVLVAPFWSIRLAFTGHVGAAFVLVAGVSLAGYAFFQSMQRGHKYVAYFAMVGALALAFVIYSATQ